MAVHGGLRAAIDGRRARPGLLVSLRNITLHCDDVDQLQGDIVVTACCVQETSSAWQYDFEVCHASLKLAEGRATVSLAAAPEP